MMTISIKRALRGSGSQGYFPLPGSLILAVLTLPLLLGTAAVRSQTPAADAVDLLVTGGRLIDPANNVDGLFDVAIANGRVVAVGPRPLLPPTAKAARTIDARGQVVAPGFIDMHVHGQSDKAQAYQARDGVTTALELEWGYAEVGSFLAARRGTSRINYGASASHGVLRALALEDDGAARTALRKALADATRQPEPLLATQGLVRESFYATLTPTQERRANDELRRALAEGGIGIGMAHAYYPGAGRPEILRTFMLAADLETPIFTHVPGRGLTGVQEVVANAAATGAALHIVHVNSISLGEIDAVLDLVAGARERGVDVSAEAYPYTAASTSIQASLFDGDWESSYGVSYDGLQWQATGERLTRESFERYRKTGGVLIIHMMKEPWIERALTEEALIVASDGMPYDPGAHPRSAGTFARVLGRYVRERGLLDLPTAIGKMTMLPARRLAPFAPAMASKGQLGVGADADLVIFDPQRVIDTATFESGPRFSEGINHVLVAGTAVVRDGELVPDVYPGQAVLGALTERMPEHASVRGSHPHQTRP